MCHSKGVPPPSVNCADHRLSIGGFFPRPLLLFFLSMGVRFWGQISLSLFVVLYIYGIIGQNKRGKAKKTPKNVLLYQDFCFSFFSFFFCAKKKKQNKNKMPNFILSNYCMLSFAMMFCPSAVFLLLLLFSICSKMYEVSR